MKNGVLLLVCMTAFFYLSDAAARADDLPRLKEIPASLSDSQKEPLLRKKEKIELQLKNFQDSGNTFNAKTAEAQTDEEYARLQQQQAAYIDAAQDFNKNIDAKESAFFYAQQTRTLTPIQDGGHPIEAKGSPPLGLHGLVGGTTWTYGFKWPRKECDAKCTQEVERSLASQLGLFCSSQSDPQKCLRNGLPFTKESYDLVVSMGSAHTAIEDLATRVLWDGPSFGEYSQQNAPMFALLKGRQFDALDCHSNGAMLCLAALRSGDTTAKKVRLFGPQINAEAAARWREWADNTGGKIEIYINNGDPIPAISWKQPAPQTAVGKAATAAWLANPITGPAAIAEALMHTWTDSQSATMDGILRGYGLEVKRTHSKSERCAGSQPDINCHSMLLYEESAGIFPVKH